MSAAAKPAAQEQERLMDPRQRDGTEEPRGASAAELRAEETEFVTISYWESVPAMTRFTGGDPNRIHHLERDAEFLIELPQGVQVLEIAAASGRCTLDLAA
jgi:heme-degrading monooxygenase HmoA